MAGCIADSAGADRMTDLTQRTVILLVGGSSGEREVSLQSGAALQQALEGLQDENRIRGLQRIEWMQDGRWSDDSTIAPPVAFLSNLPPNAVFLLGLHGGLGEDGSLQGLLSSLGLPYSGSGVQASALCMDKHQSRLLFSDNGLTVAPGALITEPTVGPEQAKTCRKDGGGPWFVKPRRGGSSLATTCVTSWQNIGPALDAVRSAGDEPLVEAAIDGVEVTVGLLDQDGDLPRALPLVEVRPAPGHFFDFEEKYTSSGAQEFCPPQVLEPARCAEVSALAQRAFRLAGCDGYARMDFIVPPDGPPVCLEINTLPGFTQRSLLPLAARAVGIGFQELVELILKRALKNRTP
ncbi:MAG: D-alanine--D-alanine ligase [Planctomycetes bacterium]|nr:D-alanine--D-alanine ligase [Planctomycetota bacterium]